MEKEPTKAHGLSPLAKFAVVRVAFGLGSSAFGRRLMVKMGLVGTPQVFMFLGLKQHSETNTNTGQYTSSRY